MSIARERAECDDSSHESSRLRPNRQLSLYMGTVPSREPDIQSAAELVDALDSFAGTDFP